MRTILLFILLSTGAFAQNRESLSTIYANEHTNVALFFPSPVKQGIAGGANFIFSYNENEGQHFGLLKGLPGKRSNLLVLTTDGSVYSYWLEYRENVSKVNYFVDSEESIGNERYSIESSVAELASNAMAVDHNLLKDSLALRTRYLENLSEIYLRTSKGKIKSKRRKKLKLSLVDMIYNKNDVFMVFELENRSKIDFQLNFLNVYVSQGSKRKNASFQKLLKEPVFKYEVPEMVKAKDKGRFVYVLPKFIIGDNEQVEIEIRETKGNRRITLHLKEKRFRR